MTATSLLLSALLVLSIHFPHSVHGLVERSLSGGINTDRRQESCTKKHPCHFALIGDLDTRSHNDDDTFSSKMLAGRFWMSGDIPSYNLDNDTPKDIRGKYAEGGRGMELSELVMYNGTLLAFDDRTGIVYELGVTIDGSLRGNKEVLPVPKAMQQYSDLFEPTSTLQIEPFAKIVLREGDGVSSTKGMKIEWACDKDGDLYIGSFGKEFTTPDGSQVTGTNNLWISILKQDGSIERHDWTANYGALRSATGTQAPGYLMHEAANWSPTLNRWIFLPRRLSAEVYDEVKDEKRGATKVLITDWWFSNVEVKDINFNNTKPERGFSSFKFVPGTDDKIIIALRSEEEAAANAQRTYLTVLDIDGNVLLDEALISDAFKFEGIEIW